MTGIDLYGGLTGTGAILRTERMDDENRGPDSVECAWDNARDEHVHCWFDYSSLTSNYGFICGCVCHDDPELQAITA